MKAANSVFSALGTTVFTVMSALATEHGAINLGQGFPDDEGPDDVRAAAAKAIIDGPNQYPPMMGLPALRQAVATANKRFYGLDVDWQSEVMVTSGATEALNDCLTALLNPGDEAIIFEPAYDSYRPVIEAAGAKVVAIPLEPPHWSLPMEKLEAAFSDRTKLVLVNTPMNPIGKVFTKDELGRIAALMERHDAYAVCDEVYEHLVFSGHAHVPLMTLPGMRERCLRIGSAGKTFSLTGWKIGYITGPAPLMEVVAKTHQFVTFTTPPGLQAAVAYGLGKDDAYFAGLASSLEAKRDLLAKGLRAAGFDVLPADGTYFISADFRPLGFNGTDEEFCREITVKAKVAAIPLSAFYSSPGAPRHLARFCFCKQDAILEEASARLKAYAQGIAA
ncbi:aminotransferase [Parvibaculum sp.]|uniref:aminotransferase n=1 Tax=Parvibaculum sp. TaxID=2024848 RepID=UPI001B248FCF|nr:aminotransferase [Parvibaculum sp.]MBO6634510.1 aminotransferase [Parvibaculum sp.]MBO6679018.1 aminotransferase [Parvibaculum sp.]MBO6685275.1 aminotransferase [Parvibaculum sp.]